MIIFKLSAGITSIYIGFFEECGSLDSMKNIFESKSDKRSFIIFFTSLQFSCHFSPYVYVYSLFGNEIIIMYIVMHVYDCKYM